MLIIILIAIIVVLIDLTGFSLKSVIETVLYREKTASKESKKPNKKTTKKEFKRELNEVEDNFMSEDFSDIDFDAIAKENLEDIRNET